MAIEKTPRAGRHAGSAQGSPRRAPRALFAPRGARRREGGLWSIALGATVIAPTLDVLARRRVTVFAHRAPTLLLRFDGSLLLRREESRFDPLLFQLPPRITRFEASPATPSGPYGRRTGAG